MPITPYIYNQQYRGFADLRVSPDEPIAPPAMVDQGLPAITAPRAPGKGRPHNGATVAKVRDLFERTDLTYAEIAAKTGVTPAIITHWKRDRGWRRPAHAPRATESVPAWRAGRKLKL